MKKCGPRWKRFAEFPGDTPLPIFGNAFQVGFDADGNVSCTIYIYDYLLIN